MHDIEEHRGETMCLFGCLRCTGWESAGSQPVFQNSDGYVIAMHREKPMESWWTASQSIDISFNQRAKKKRRRKKKFFISQD